MRPLTSTIAAAAVAVTFGLAGAAMAPTANAKWSDGAIDKTDVANEISLQFEKQVGHKPDSVSCPEDLAAAEGASERCTYTDKGDTYDVTFVVTSVDDAVHYVIHPDPVPRMKHLEVKPGKRA